MGLQVAPYGASGQWIWDLGRYLWGVRSVDLGSGKFAPNISDQAALQVAIYGACHR